jgi:hypothetical protein
MIDLLCVDTEEKSSMNGRWWMDTEEKSSMTDHKDMTNDGKSSISGFFPGVRGSKSRIPAPCCTPHRAVYGGGSPHPGKADSCSISRNCAGTPGGAIYEGGELSDDNEGAWSRNRGR